MFTRRSALLAIMLASALGAGPAVAQEKLKAVATFSILADLVKNVGGERVEVASLVGPGSDAHVYAPSPADAKKLADAKIVFTNGLGFEGWIARLIKASATKAPNVVATKGIKPRRTGGHGHDHSDGDPHAWQSVANVKIYVGNIRDALIAADPSGKGAYETNATGYLAKLDALDREVKDICRPGFPPTAARSSPPMTLSAISRTPMGSISSRRRASPQTRKPRQKTSPGSSARSGSRRFPAVFLENVTDARLLKRIADETGAKIGGTLYSDALTGEKGDAPTYIDMIRHNIRTLSAALMS